MYKNGSNRFMKLSHARGLGLGNQVVGENPATQNLGSGDSGGSWEVHFQRVFRKPQPPLTEYYHRSAGS